MTPGPANVAIFGRASQKGFRSVLPFVIGVVSGFLVVLATSEVLVRWGVELAGPFYLALKIVGSKDSRFAVSSVPCVPTVAGSWSRNDTLNKYCDGPRCRVSRPRHFIEGLAVSIYCLYSLGSA